MKLATCVFFLALRAAAHEGYPISPVHATLLVEPDRTIADLRADSIFWIEEVTGLHPMPARDWPAETTAKVEAYTNAHFRLTANGALLQGRLVEARYQQFPWEVNEQGAFFLRVVYPMVPAGATLSGTANFYEEYRREMIAEYAGRTIPSIAEYRTLVRIPGRRRMNFTLTPEAPSFTASANEARRTQLAMAREGLARGASAALGAAAGFPVLVAAALCLGAKPAGRAAWISLAAAAAAGFAAGGLANAPAWLVWAALLAGAFGAWRGKAWMAVPALGGLGFVWRDAAAPWLPHGALAAPAALLGALAAGSALFGAALLGVRAERRRLLEVSESRVDELFARRARLTATALAMVGAYGLWQSAR